MKKYKTIVSFDELNDEAKKKAREWYKDSSDGYFFLDESLNEFITEKVKALGYSIETPVSVLYSLSYCQGDGVSFTAVLSKNGETYEVNQSGRYVHEMTMSVYHEKEDGTETDEPEVLEEMRSIAKEAERFGYGYIEAEDSDDNVDNNISANEYTFTLEGVRMDADN